MIHERRLRLASALVLAVFVSLHLLSHALGVVSFQWLEEGRRLQALLWHNPLGTVLLYGSSAPGVGNARPAPGRQAIGTHGAS